MATANMEDIVRYYFNKNYTYGVILYCLEKYHGIIISRGTLLNHLKDYGFRRRSCEVNKDRVCWCILQELDGPSHLLGYGAR